MNELFQPLEHRTVSQPDSLLRPSTNLLTEMFRPETPLRESANIDDDDYSTDSSAGARQQQQPEIRQPSRRRRHPRLSTNRDEREPTPKGRTIILPEVYRHSNKVIPKGVWSHSLGLYPSDHLRTGVEDITSVNLEDLVKYSSVDLLSRAWPLVPSSVKNLTYAPFSHLPELPDVVGVRHPDTDQVAHFMRLMSIEIAKRHTSPTPVFLRSLLVSAAASAEAKRAKEAFLSVHSYVEQSFSANWETDTGFDINDSEEEVSMNPAVPSSGESHVDSLDWTMALLSVSLHPRIPLRVIRSLHGVLNRCGINSSSSTLYSWGVKHLTQMLLMQLEKEASLQQQETPDEWLGDATALLFKIGLASKNIDTLLTLFRWVYRYQELSKKLTLRGIVPWITSLEAYARPRMRLPIPISSVKVSLVPLAHSLGLEFLRSVFGVCIIPTDGEMYGVLLSSKGIYKIDLKPPYHVINKNENCRLSDCRGVSLEGKNITVQSDRAHTVSYYNSETLEILRVMESSETKSQSGFSVFSGSGKLVKPHFYHDELSPRYACFDALVSIKGIVEPNFLTIPPSTDSLSVQFFICPRYAQQNTSLELVRIKVSEKIWLSVKIALDSRNSTMLIVFEHGADVMVEVREPIQENWTLWSATLFQVNDVATWTVYRDGVLFENSGANGTVFKPSSSTASVEFLNGTFSGFISGFQLWHRSQSVSELLASTTGRLSGTAEGHLMCFFKMHEGAGCCFQGFENSFTWKGTAPNWCAPEKAFQGRRTEKSEVVPYIPSGDYYIVTSEYETAIIEKGFCTWMDQNGRILEQQFMNVDPNEMYFLCTHTSRMYSIVLEKGGFCGLRWIQTDAPPTKHVKDLASVKTGDEICNRVVEISRENSKLTPMLLSQYLLYRVNVTLLASSSNVTNTQRSSEIFSWIHRASVSPQTVARLVEMCVDLVESITHSSKTENEFPQLLLLCVCGRMLTRQLSRMGRGCPPKLVPTVVNMYEKLHEQNFMTNKFLTEAQVIFSHLHRVFLAECVSHDYQLQRILEAKKLIDVKELLVPDYLPSLVTSIIEKELKKPFMTFLSRLKEECMAESEYILSGRSAPYSPSSATLATLLSVLSQKTCTQWHLVCVALMTSLCKGILRIFDRLLPSQQVGKGRTKEELEILKQTFIGIVVFPIAHFLSDLDIDSNIAVDVLALLNEMREALTTYTPHLNSQSICHSFTETHRIIAPESSSYTTILDLRHAQSVEVSYEHSKTEATPQIILSLLTNDYKKLIEVLNNNNSNNVKFNSGGSLEILSKPTSKSKETIITVNASVELRTESTHWIRDICFALSHAIIRITHQLLLTDLPDAIVFPRESLFRGGLSNEVLREHHIHTTMEDRLLDRSEQMELIQFCEGTLTGDLFTEWKRIYGERRIPYQERLEPILRWFCAAHVWHSHRSRGVTLQKALEETLGLARKKAFLILEALQQGHEAVMLERARFLLKMMNPRAKLEAMIAEYQQTEEPVSGISPSSSTRAMPTVRSVTSVASFSRDRTESRSTSFMKRVATGVSDLSLSHHEGLGGILRPRNSLLTAGVVSEGMHSNPESISSQVFNFLLHGYKGYSNEELVLSLVKKAQQASIHTAAYRLQEELCAAHQCDESMTSSIVSSHLLYRELSHLQHNNTNDTTEKNPPHQSVNLNTTTTTTTTTTSNYEASTDHHFLELMIGCGFQREIELQKASCSFVHSIIQSLLNRCEAGSGSDYKHVEAISLCAILCHPWDGVDMSIIRPAKIFRVLKEYIFAPLTAQTHLKDLNCSTNEEKIWWNFIKERGIFSLMYRSVIIPNSLQPSADRISIVEGDTLGVHVEDADVCCFARNHWRALKPDVKLGQSYPEGDCFANLASGCIVAEMPEALYFEVTLELVLNEQASVSVGISSTPLSSTEAVGKESSVVFTSDGNVMFGQQSMRFSEGWNVSDVIGCGILAPFNSVFFTRNGEFLGIATDCSFTRMIPFIGVHATSTLVKLVVNFGEHSPFKFDIASIHNSCRTRLTSPAMLSDSAFLTAHYLVTLCFKNLLHQEESESSVNQDSVCALLESAAVFLREVVLEILRRLKHMGMNDDFHKNIMEHSLQKGNVLLCRIFRTVGIITDCFRFDAVTGVTHLEILRLCSVTVIDAHDRWAKVRAARCLRNASRILREDYFGEAVQALRRYVTPDVVVNSLTELARAKVFKERKNSSFVPRWQGDLTTVHGKGVFYGSSPIPSKGTHMVGFRIRRRQQEGRGPGAPLGGCYYVGLAHGHPPVTSMSSLIGRNDVYVLQDTDDADQVPHILLRRHCIPRSSQRRIYGNDEIVWVEFNADAGEITYYRGNMILIGLAFANILRVDDLYPIVFHFNDDASCELIEAPAPDEDSCELLLIGLRRSVALHTLQQLHVTPYFSAVISQWINRFLTRSHRDLDNCLVALAILGGEKSCEFCQNETHGAVVVDSVSDLASKAIVYLEADGDMRLFSTTPSSLKPSFVRPPLFTLSEGEGMQCAKLLLGELCRSLYEASAIAPLILSEEERRTQVEKHFLKMFMDHVSLNYVGLLSVYESLNDVGEDISPISETQHSNTVLVSDSSSFFCDPVAKEQSTSATPVAIDQRLSTTSIYTPNPSISMTSGNFYSIIRGNLLLENIFSFSVSITTAQKDTLIYIGVSNEIKLSADPQKVSSCSKIWALCNHDSSDTNSINCSVEPGMIFSTGQKLFGSGDVIQVQVDRQEGTASFSRIRGNKRVDFGILFETIPQDERLRPFVLAPSESTIVFSFLDGRTFPARNIFPPSGNSNSWKCPTLPVRCSTCDVELRRLWYEGEGGICLCTECFNSWQYPKILFHLAQPDALVPDYIVSQHNPKDLNVGNVVEFFENMVLTWSLEQSVNVNIEGTICMAEKDMAFATLKPFSEFGMNRVDLTLSHVAGVDGFAFGGLLPFSPSWGVSGELTRNYILGSGALLISNTTIPHNTKVAFGLSFCDVDGSRSINTAGLFVGVTNLSNSYRVMNVTDLERRISNHNIWGTWCDTKSKISNSLTVYILVDLTRGVVAVSSSLIGLHLNPMVVTCNCPIAEETILRVAIFSHDECQVTTINGFLSSNENIVDPSPSPVALGLVPDEIISPGGNITCTSNFLFDTVSRTGVNNPWKLTRLVNAEETGMLFSIGDTLTIIQQKGNIFIYRNGLLITTSEILEDTLHKPHRLVILLSTRGMIAKTVPPPYGRSHLGKIVRNCGANVGIVESLFPCQGRKRYAVRRNDVRFCALAADLNSIEVGACVAFKAGSLNLPKRGIVTSIENNTVNVCDEEDKRIWFSVELGSIYLLNNESVELAPQGLYSLLALPSSTVTRVFEVGKTKYRLQRNGSYNGIMFDVHAHESIVLSGLAVLTQTSGRHRVEVFFKKGSLHTHERESSAWTRIFSNLIEMRMGRPFNISFPGIQVEFNSTFALYINASHNCGVGHYSKDDGCGGAISSKMDSDGVLTIFVGRTSESSTPFLESSATPRGFCGSIIYMQNKDTRPPLMEEIPSHVDSLHPKDDTSDDMMILHSRPNSTRTKTKVEFTLEVFETPIILRKMVLPLLMNSEMKYLKGPAYLHVSLFYSCVDDLKGVTDLKREWIWAYYEVLPLHIDAYEFDLKDIHLLLKRGIYVFTALCEVSRGYPEKKGNTSSLVSFLDALESDCVVQNSLFSVHHFAGDVYATSTGNVIMSDNLCTISTGSHLNQSNSASYNGIMFDLRSKRDILLEEVFCVAQTTTDNVNVKVFWRDGSMEGCEKNSSQWRQVATKDMYLADKQHFSVGSLNLQLRANRVYALYINTSSSCGVRFYNSSDGHVGDVGDEFEDDGVLTIYVGKKSESPLPFAEIPTEPRALRGRITYRAFMQKPSLTQNQAVFPALKGFVVTRILAALIAYSGGNVSAPKLFEDNSVIIVLQKLVTSITTAVCSPEVISGLLSSMMKRKVVEELSNGIVTVPLSNQIVRQFDSFCKGDMAIVANGNESVSTGKLVRLVQDLDEEDNVLVQDESKNLTLKFTSESLLPIIMCHECQKPFALKSLCEKTEQIHTPPKGEEERLINMFAKYFSHHSSLNSKYMITLAKTMIREPLSRGASFPTEYGTLSEGVKSLGQSLDSQTILYTIPLYLFLEGRKGGVPSNFVSPFVFSGILNAFVSLLFTQVKGRWRVAFFTDFPLRARRRDPMKVYLLSLSVMLSDGTQRDLTSFPVTYYTAKGGPMFQDLHTKASSLHYPCLQMNGEIRFQLKIHKGQLPPPLPILPILSEDWVWSNDSKCIELLPGKSEHFKGHFYSTTWPKGKPRFSQLGVSSTTHDTVFFLEVQVIVPSTINFAFWDSVKSQIMERRSLSLTHEDELTLAFTTENEFVIYDSEDIVRCCIVLEKFHSLLPRGVVPTVAIANVGQHPVTIRLHALSASKSMGRGSRCGESTYPWTSKPGSYSPEWVSYDPLKVNISSNRLTASCNGDSGLAVIGSPLPMTGISTFVVQIDRADRTRGDPLGSGHFAGIVLSTFDQLSPHFEMLRKEVNTIWAVQDVQDVDSLPTQERIPPLDSSQRSDELFLVGTKLRFLLDRDSGTLSLARDGESPRVVFHNIPQNVPLSPFVRLDHLKASATLSPFSCGVWGDGAPQLSPSLILTSHPVRPSILRRFPYFVVISMFPIFRFVVDQLPSQETTFIENIWSDHVISSRLGYQLSISLESLVELGAFSRRMMCASEKAVNEFCTGTEIQEVIKKLSTRPENAIIQIKDEDSDENCTNMIILPCNYELLGQVKDTQMYRLLYFDENGPMERTLHVCHSDDPSTLIHSCDVVTKHPCIMHQVDVIQGLISDSSLCGIITDGWYDCTLNVISTFTEEQEKMIVISLLGALEHWHLHGSPHGHIMPENIYLRMDQGLSEGAITCSLWKMTYLHRHHSCASPELRQYGLRDMKGDKWSLAHVLSTFTSFLTTHFRFRHTLGLLHSDLQMTEILDQTGVLNNETQKNAEVPIFCLSTGAHHGGCSGSYHGIMFNVVAKRLKVSLTKISFFPDTTSTAKVTLFIHEGSFMGVETIGTKWRSIFQQDMNLVENVEMEITDFEPIIIPAGGKIALFLHTTSGSGVLFYSEADGVRANMAAIEEENDDVGITVGKKSESSTPFVAIQNQKRLLKGSISYTLPSYTGGYRSCLVLNSDNIQKSGNIFIGRPVEWQSHPGLILEEIDNEYLVYFADDHCEWVHQDALRMTNFDESPLWGDLERSLRVKHCKLQQLISPVPSHKCLTGQSIQFQKIHNLKIPDNSYPENSVWWISEPITTSGIIYLRKHGIHSDASLSIVSEKDEGELDFKNFSCLSNQENLFIYVDDWRRVVSALENSNVSILKLRSAISQKPLRLLFGPANTELEISPLIAFLTMRTNNGITKKVAENTYIVSMGSNEKLYNKTCILNGMVLANLHDIFTKNEKFAQTLFSSCQSDVRIISISGSISKDENVNGDSGIQFLVEIQPHPDWKEEEIHLQTQSSALSVKNGYVEQVTHDTCCTCTVVYPSFTGCKFHEVELLIISHNLHPVRLSLQNLTLSWTLDIPIPFFHSIVEKFASSTGGIHCFSFRLRVTSGVKRVFASVNGGLLYEIPSLGYPDEFQLVFNLSYPGSAVHVLRWRLLNSSESTITRHTLETVLNQLEPCHISPNIPQTVGILTRHSRLPSGATSPRCGDTTHVSQIEGAIVSYARQLLGTVILNSKPSPVYKRIQALLPFTPLRNDFMALEGLVSAESRRGSFYLVASSCTYLALPTVMQNMEMVETSVNLISVALDNFTFSLLLSTEFGITLILILFHIATVFTRSIRHMSLRCVLKLLKKSDCPLPSHEALCASFGPLLGMMNGLCRKGRMSTVVVQLGISLICEFIRRYHVERPTLTAPGKKSAVPYAIATCTRMAINSITCNPPLPLPDALTQEPKEVHRINYELLQGSASLQGVIPLYGVFSEPFRCTFGSKTFEVVLSATRSGNVVVGWDMDAALPGSLPTKPLHVQEGETRMVLPSCGYCVDPNGKIYVCLSRKKESQPLKIKAKGGDIVVVKCFYHEQAVLIQLRRGTRNESATRFETYPNEMLALPVFFAENKNDVTFHGEMLSEISRGINVAQLYNKLQEYPEKLDTEVLPQSYEFYVELALFCHNILKQEQLSTLASSSEDDTTSCSCPSHDIAGFPLLSSYLGAGAFCNEIPLIGLKPYIRRLKILDALTSVFSVVVDLRRKTELFDLWKKLKNLCSAESSEKIQNETMRPFRNRSGQKASVIIHTMQARPSARFGPYQTLMRSVFGQLFMQLQKSPIATFYASPMFTVKLPGFGSTDAGGPYRDILSQLATEIMTTHPNGNFQLNPLFVQCGRGGQSAVMPNVTMTLKSQSPYMFEFFGKLLAACFVTKDLLAVEFPALFWKLLLSEETDVRDLTAIDPDITRHLAPEELMDRTSDELEERFPGIVEIWGSYCTEHTHLSEDQELPPSNIETAKLLAEQIISYELHKYDPVMSYIQHGFDQVLPLYTLNAFRWQQVEFTTCGTPKLSFDALNEVCEINLPSSDTRMFLDVLAAMTDEDRMLLLRFTTGQTRLPLKESIKVQRSGTHDSLPTSSTCFFTLRLPSYSSSEAMREKVLYAIRQCKAIDTDGQAREHIVLDN